MSQSTWWDKVKVGGKKGLDMTWRAADKIGTPVNKLSNKLGSEAFWPTTLDKESDKAARILKSFCTDGFYAEEERQPQDGPKQKQKVIKKIPAKVIKNAKGLAIFTTMRSGLWFSGAGGSGILVGRLPDGSWSPPSGILLHTAGLGFLVGIDIYDCVVVINTEEALEGFTKLRCTLGSEISVAAGPVGAGGILDTEIHKRQAPIFTYLKSRGFYAGVQIDGTIIIERTDENERFYGYKYPVRDILAGKVRHPPWEIKRLMETIKAAQGDSDFDASVIPTEPPPGDYQIEAGLVFGIPDKEDPDPYGVLALEKEGFEVKEAGTQKRASWEQFTFNPSPTSPVHSVYNRSSQDLTSHTLSRRSSWRTSAFSNEPKTPSSLRNSMDPFTTGRPVMSDMSTQTDFPPEPPSPTRQSAMSRRSSRGSMATGRLSHMENVPEHGVLNTSPSRKSSERVAKVNGYTTPPHTPPAVDEEHEEHGHDEDEDAHIEEPIVHSVQTVQPASPQVVSKPRLVTVPKRGPPPKLPPRNPQRGSVSTGTSMAVADTKPVSMDSAEKESARESSPAPDATEHEREVVAETPSADSEATVVEVEHHDMIQEKLSTIKLDDDHEHDGDDEDEEEMRNPWAKVQEIKKRASEDNGARMPGGFV